MLITRTAEVRPVTTEPDALPDWAEWKASAPYSVGIEEEVMVLDPRTWLLARDTDAVLADLPADLAPHVRGETHQAAAELATSPHASAVTAAREALALRRNLLSELERQGLRAASAGTHPMATWNDVQVSTSDRYQDIYRSMRELARREPTFALHVHVGVDDPDRAIRLVNRLRVHLPLLLALSGNSPYWQGRDSGLTSARTPIFQAFPRVGIPRSFPSYASYVEAVDRLVRSGAIPDPTFLWWDVRLQPSLGTIEIRIMDAQITAAASGALLALVQSLAHLELEEGYADNAMITAPEVLDENRFLASRDGMQAEFVDVSQGRRIPVRSQLKRLLAAARAHAEQLGCAEGLDAVSEMADYAGAVWQRHVTEHALLPKLVESLALRFVDDP